MIKDIYNLPSVVACYLLCNSMTLSFINAVLLNFQFIKKSLNFFLKILHKKCFFLSPNQHIKLKWLLKIQLLPSQDELK